MISYAERRFLWKQIGKNLSYSVSSKGRKVEEVGFKTDDIINTNQLTYITSEKLTFQNGKCLVYKAKKGLWTTFQRYFSYYSSISGVGFLIYTNPFQTIFPAAIPILWVIQLIRILFFTQQMIKIMFKRYQWNQSIVDQVYLLSTGSTTQVYFADATRRKLFGQPLSKIYYNTIFADPIQRQKQDVMPNYNPFPEKLQDYQKKSFSGTWCKYYSNGQNYLLIPKNSQLVKKDILIQLFKGKTIKNY